MDAKAYARIMASAAKKLGEKIGAATGQSPPPPTGPIGPQMQSGAFTMQEDVIKGGGKKGFVFGGQTGRTREDRDDTASFWGEQVYDPSSGGYSPFIGPFPESGYSVTGPGDPGFDPNAFMGGYKEQFPRDWDTNIGPSGRHQFGPDPQTSTVKQGPLMQTGGFTSAQETSKRYNYLSSYYDRLGTEIRKSTNPVERNKLLIQRNRALKEAKGLAALGINIL